MNLIITNPLGFWALLGIPAVIIIHFLQRQARVIPVSTLFLLAQTQRESVSGRRFDRLTNSIPLWLQLLMVLLLTWLLVEPRHVRPSSTQQVAVILDSSASMTVFRENLVEQLGETLPTLQGSASRLQLYVFESDPAQPIVYAGEEVEEALEAIAGWTPAAGALDPTSSLRLARSRVNREGILLYATDTPVEGLPFDAQTLAVGEPRPNAGFTGVSFTSVDDKLGWKAVVRNYSDEPVTREWQVEFADGSRSQPRQLDIAAGGLATIAAGFPDGSDRLRVLLDKDEFPLDDNLPLVRPAPKPLLLWANTSPKFSDFAERLVGSFPNIAPVNDASSADLSLVSYDPLFPELPQANSIVLVDETTKSSKYLRGGIVAKKHELMDGLNWQALLVRESIALELTPSDEVLLWQGDRALIALRETTVFDETTDTEGAVVTGAARPITQLILNFDPTLSNALKLPATVVLLHRFCEALRDRKVAPEARNTETGQVISLSTHEGPEAAPLVFTTLSADGSGAVERTIPLDRAHDLRAPAEPGFFTISQDGELLLRSAAHFADTREADLRECAATEGGLGATGAAVDLHTREDSLWRLWALLVLAALLLAWYYTKERPRDEGEETDSPAPRPSTTSQPV